MVRDIDLRGISNKKLLYILSSSELVIIYCMVYGGVPGLLVESELSESLWTISSSLLSKVAASSTRVHLPSMNLSKEESASIGVPRSKLVTASRKDGRSSCGNERSDVASNSSCGARSNRPLTKASSSQRAHGSGWRNSSEAACFCKKRMYGKRRAPDVVVKGVQVRTSVSSATHHSAPSRKCAM